MGSTQAEHEKNFNPIKYQSHWTGLNHPGIQFTYRCLHSIFEDDIVRGETLLDVGSGPNIHTCISASRSIKSITLSDLCERNLVELQKWIHQRPGAHDWAPNFKFIADLENESDYRNLESHLRSAIHDVIPLDILDHKACQAIGHHFDVLICGRVLEPACLTTNDYYKGLRNLHSLLCPNGYLLLISPVMATFYYAADVRFQSFLANKEFLKKAMQDTGFNIIQWHVSPCEDVQPISDVKGFSVLVAQKK